jgi:hypothetical protein
MRRESSKVLLMNSRFTPACFSKSLPSLGARSYLRSYSSNICIVDVYGLRYVQCGQLSLDVTKSVSYIPRQLTTLYGP